MFVGWKNAAVNLSTINFFKVIRNNCDLNNKGVRPNDRESLIIGLFGIKETKRSLQSPTEDWKTSNEIYEKVRIHE